jgi:DNA-binding transcriptional ArsR family regulator
MPRLGRDSGNPTLAIEIAPAYEFLMSLATVNELENREIAEVGTQWLDATHERAGTELMARLAEFTQGTGDFFIHLVPLAYEAPAPRTVESLLGHIETVDAREILLLFVGYHDYHMRRTVAPEVMRDAVHGDRAAARQLIDSFDAFPDWQQFAERLLATDPEVIKQELLAILRGWYERAWSSEEERVLPILTRDAESKRAMALEMPFDRFVETATNGVSFVPHAGVDRLVLIPSWVNRPWVSYAEYGGAIFLVYPVADESLIADDDAPPLRLLRLTKALGDEKRLRILRILAAGPKTLVELAELLEVPKTTMHHHMVTLRSAGLVAVGAGAKEYRLRGDVMPNLAQMLGGYLAAADTTNGNQPSTRLGRSSARTPATPRGRRPSRQLAPSSRRTTPEA